MSNPLEWMSFEEFESEYRNFLRGKSELSIKCDVRNMRKIINELHDRYRTGQDWIEADTKEKIFRINYWSEIYYILPWYKKIRGTLNARDWGGEEIKLLEYFTYKRSHERYGNFIYKWSRYSGLITDEVHEALETYKSESFAVSLAVHCSTKMQAFRDLTDDDIEFTYKINPDPRSPYKPKSFQDMRIRLGYSDKVVTNKIITIWDNLFSQDNKIWAQCCRRFYDYLILSDAGHDTIRRSSYLLRDLFHYLESKKTPNFQQFSYDDFLEITKIFGCGKIKSSLKDQSIALKIPHLKRFFEWGIQNEPSFFPLYLNYPDDEWAALNKKAKQEYVTSEGHAFHNKEIAEKMVQAIVNYNAENEKEELCRCFWMIVMSATPRFSFILNLESREAMKTMPNQPEAFGVYSPDEDKAGNKYGQFPILDPIGVQAIIELEKRAQKLNLKPIWNKRNQRSYVHLFQLSKPPWILSESAIRSFFKKIQTQVYPELTNEKVTAHGYRTFLLTHIAVKTGNLEAVRIAAGHLNEEMTRLYLKSKISKNALLHRVIEQYDKGEITGKFYVRLVELLSSEDSMADEILRALTTEMTIADFIEKFGRKKEMGYCFVKGSCVNWYKCWGCRHFLMTKKEINQAIEVLTKQIINMREMIKYSRDFSSSNSIAAGQMKSITLIIKRLTELGLDHKQINEMVMDTFRTWGRD